MMAIMYLYVSGTMCTYFNNDFHGKHNYGNLILYLKKINCEHLHDIYACVFMSDTHCYFHEVYQRLLYCIITLTCK